MILDESLFEETEESRGTKLGSKRGPYKTRNKENAKKLTYNKICDRLEHDGYDIKASVKPNCIMVSKKHEKNLQKAKDYCKEVGLKCSQTYSTLQDRYYLDIELPENLKEDYDSSNKSEFEEIKSMSDAKEIFAKHGIEVQKIDDKNYIFKKEGKKDYKFYVLDNDAEVRKDLEKALKTLTEDLILDPTEEDKKLLSDLLDKYKGTEYERVLDQLKSKYEFEDASKGLNEEKGLEENLSTEQELEQLPYVYQVTEIEPNTYKLDTEWVTTSKKAHSIYLAIRKALEEKYGEKIDKLTYVKNEWRDGQKEVHCVLEVRFKEESLKETPLKEDVAEYKIVKLGLNHTIHDDYPKWSVQIRDKDKVEKVFNVLDKIDEEEENKPIAILPDGNTMEFATSSFYDKEDIEEIVEKALTESLNEDLSQEQQQEYGLNTLINTLIKSEYDAIDEYNSAIVTLEAEGQGEYTDVIRSIIEDERHHIGNLQEIMNRITPGTEQEFEHGKEEAIETLDEEKPEEETTTIDTEEGVIKTYKLDKVEDMKESLDNHWYGLVNHSEMTDTTFALISKDKEELEKHWEDLILITEGNPNGETDEKFMQEVVLPKIEELDKIGVHFVDTDEMFPLPDNRVFSVENNEYFIGEEPVEIIKKSSSRF